MNAGFGNILSAGWCFLYLSVFEILLNFWRTCSQAMLASTQDNCVSSSRKAKQPLLWAFTQPAGHSSAPTNEKNKSSQGLNRAWLEEIGTFHSGIGMVCIRKIFFCHSLVQERKSCTKWDPEKLLHSVCFRLSLTFFESLTVHLAWLVTDLPRGFLMSRYKWFFLTPLPHWALR